MNKRRKTTLATLLICIATVAGGLSLWRTFRPIDQYEATQIALTYIITQGYTDLPATVDAKSIRFEFLEDRTDVKSVLEYRHDQLLRTPSLVLSDGNGGWIVGFPYREENGVSRGISMNRKGRGLTLLHQDMY
jgi:hypothetical protein